MMTHETSNEYLAPRGTQALIADNIRSIKNRPNYHFVTPEGQVLALFCDRVSICKRIDSVQGTDWRHKEDIEDAASIAGLILVIGRDASPPYVFTNEIELAQIWERLHLLYKVPITRKEKQYLEIILGKALKTVLPRKSRIAASCFAMLIITGLSFMLLRYGQVLLAAAFEFASIATYSVWISLAKEGA